MGAALPVLVESTILLSSPVPVHTLAGGVNELVWGVGRTVLYMGCSGSVTSEVTFGLIGDKEPVVL